MKPNRGEQRAMEKQMRQGREEKPRVDAISEADLQESIIELAQALGYLVMHLPDSRGQAAEGWPDLYLLPTNPPGPPLYIELKAAKGYMTTGRMVATRDGRGRWAVGQTEWRDALLASKQRWFLLRPSDWLDGTIERILKGDDHA